MPKTLTGRWFVRTKTREGFEHNPAWRAGYEFETGDEGIGAHSVAESILNGYDVRLHDRDAVEEIAAPTVSPAAVKEGPPSKWRALFHRARHWCRR